MWSLNSQRGTRTSGPKNFQSSAKKDFFNTIGRVGMWRGGFRFEHICFPPLSFGGALLVRPWLRFHIPLIEPDMQISRIRLSDKTSRLHPRHVVPKPA